LERGDMRGGDEADDLGDDACVGDEAEERTTVDGERRGEMFCVLSSISAAGDDTRSADDTVCSAYEGGEVLVGELARIGSTGDARGCCLIAGASLTDSAA
jgi:hypothetical protein